jgi:rhamnose transport system ATP-binding protein
MEGRVLLRASSLEKHYAGVRALCGVSLEIREGEVHALVGENGAGKSTLVRILTGAEPPDAGSLEVDGELVHRFSPLGARTRGIAAIRQQPALFAELSVAENLALGVEPVRLFRRVSWSRRREQARELLARIGARIDPDSTAAALSLPEQQRVEIARALGTRARILLLDEPTAALPEREAACLLDIVRRLRDQGVAILYISHRLDEIYEIASRVSVLRDGALVETRAIGEVSREDLIRLMVGRSLSAVFPEREGEIGEVVLEMRGLGRRASRLSGIDLDVRRGEIVGLFGLVGAGRTELARILFGLEAPDDGEVWLAGQRVRVFDPRVAIASGIGYVPEDRRRHGVILELALVANTSLALLERLRRRFFLDRAREREIASSFVSRLGIRARSIHGPVSELSGGNQQKVSLARSLATKPRVLLLDEPTQGIDVGAKAEIYALVRELARNGVAILLISSDLEEVLGMSDRVGVLFEGTMAGIVPASKATREEILARALGQHRA